MKDNKIKKILPYAVCIIMLLASIFSYKVQVVNKRAVADQQGAKITELKAESDKLKAKLEAVTYKNAEEAVGLDYKRVSKDDDVVIGLIRTLTTWDSLESYDGARNKAMKILGKDHPIFKDYMPKVESYKLGTGGKPINEIDAYGTNMRFQNMTSYLIGMDANANYTYATKVTVQSADKNGKTAAGDVLFVYTISKDGKIKNFEANSITP